MADYGAPFLERLRAALAAHVPSGWLDAAEISLVNADYYMSASGAVVLALQKELGIP